MTLFRDARRISQPTPDASDLARFQAGRMFGKRVSTIFDPRFSDNPWVAFFDTYVEGQHMARGRTEAEAINHLIQHTLGEAH